MDKDYEWFCSTEGSREVYKHKGKYIAIWNRQVAAVGPDAVVVEREAKTKHGKNIRPVVYYVPTDEQIDSIL